MKIIRPRWNPYLDRTVWWVGDPEGEGHVTKVTRWGGNNRWTLERWDHGQGQPALLSDPWLTLTRKAHIMALLCEDDIVLSDPPCPRCPEDIMSPKWDRKPRHLPFCPWTKKSTVAF